MPRTKSSGRGANGNGSIRKVTTTRNGKKYLTVKNYKATVENHI